MFCTLERDSKTFKYFQRYITYFENNMPSSILDNQIQIEELNRHLENNNFSHSDTGAKLDWIQKNGKAFREYLNAIKLMYFTCRVNKLNPHDLTESSFAALEDLVNKERSCLQTIC